MLAGIIPLVLIIFGIIGLFNIGLININKNKCPKCNSTVINITNITNLTKQYDYAIVFDAGSTNTRMFIYQWLEGFKAHSGKPLEVVQKTSCKTDDSGIDKIKTKEELIQKFNSCISRAYNEIPDNRKYRTNILLGATGGMRLLEAKNKTKSDLIIRYVREYFRELNFLFRNESQARIITGEEESIGAWISANYFENNFDPRGTLFQNSTPPTKGILDLGGASTQIAYVPQYINPSLKEFYSDIKIYGINYRTYRQSFLCWGINEFRFLYQGFLISKNNYNNQTKSSCFPKNSSVTLNNLIFESPCGNGLLFNYTSNFTANYSRFDRNSAYNFEGLSNLDGCENEVEYLLPKPNCNYGTCSFNGIYQPSLENSNFMAFSNLYYAINNTVGLLSKAGEYDMPGFKNATKYICSLSFEELKKLNSNNNVGLSDNLLANQCFLSVFTLKLVSSYGFTSFDNLKFTEKIFGNSLNWALGYLINELNRDDFLPYEFR